METLPDVVIPEIAKHLSVKDLAACCAVSPWWRDVFGSDEVWKPRCDVDSEEYLRITPCRVEPKFATPESEDTTLSPIGRWRTAYMREAHLRRNWISGNCVEENFNVPADHIRYMCFINNDFFIVWVYNSVELRTTVNPSVCIAQIKGPSAGSLCNVKVAQGDKIITFSTGNVIHVIDVNTETCTFLEKHTFCTDGDFLLLYRFLCVNNVFLAYDNKCMYIWNIEDGTHLKTEPYPLSRCFIYIESYENCEDVIVTAEEQKDEYHIDYHYFIYSVKELKYFEFTRKPKSGKLSCAIVNNFFALFSFGGGLEVYDYRTSCMIYNVESLSCRYESLHVLGGSLIFCTEEDELMRVSLSARSVKCLPLGISGVYYLNNMDRKLLLIGKDDIPKVLWTIASEPLVITPKVKVSELHVIEREEKLWFTHPVNQTFSKMLMRRSNADFGVKGMACVHLW